MNRLLIFIAIIIISLGHSQAQVKVEITSGLLMAKSSYNLDASFYGPREVKMTTYVKPGFYLGATTTTPLNEKLNFVTGLVISRRNFSYKRNRLLDLPNYLYEWMDYHISYLEIPLKLSGPISEYSPLSVNGGFYFSIGIGGNCSYTNHYFRYNNLSARVEYYDIMFANRITKKNLYDIDNTYQAIRPLDMGIEGGLDYNSRSFAITLNARIGLSNIYPPLDIPPTTTPDNTGIMFMLMTGVKLPLSYP